MVNGWSELTVAFNQVTRSMGEPDFYPFVLSIPAVRKLHFIHQVIARERNDGPQRGRASRSTAAGACLAPGVTCSQAPLSARRTDGLDMNHAYPRPSSTAPTGAA